MRFPVIVMLPVMFNVEADSPEAALALSTDQLEDFAFDQLGKYVECDLRLGNFEEATILEADELDS